VILGINILLWFLTHYPQGQIKAEYQQKRDAIAASAPALPGQTNAVNPTLAAQLQELDDQESGARLSHSFAGRLGHFIEPALSPLGLDWKIGIGIAASFAAREVFISTMAIVYNAGSLGTGDNATSNLARVFQAQKRPDGSRLFTPLLGITLMVFYVFALQCASTVVVVKRETNSWKWPLFQWTYLGMLAWGMAFLVAQVGRLMGWG
jgi:ferrous iron transport protein B